MTQTGRSAPRDQGNRVLVSAASAAAPSTAPASAAGIATPPTPATTSAARSTPTSAPSLGCWPGFVHHQGASKEVLSVAGGNCALRLRVILEVDKAKTPGFARE